MRRKNLEISLRLILGVSLKWAMCHEMGHNLNLGHSNNRNALMYPTGHGQDENRLHEDDRQGIVFLYGGPNGRVSIYVCVANLKMN